MKTEIGLRRDEKGRRRSCHFQLRGKDSMRARVLAALRGERESKERKVVRNMRKDAAPSPACKIV